MGTAAGAREGDWKCDGCDNRNYAFRSFCNRCKQARLLVDSKTPADSKWLPRIGDWICAGCSNNNYASREKCNKCGEPKEDAALPAIALPGAAMAAPAQPLPTTGPTGLGSFMNMGLAMPLHSPFLLGMDWPFSSSGLGGSMHDDGNWRLGDWLCVCGYHNYSSRIKCKQCHAPVPSAPPVAGMDATPMQPSINTGTKRPMPDELPGDLASKRVKLGGDYAIQPYLPNQLPESFSSLEGRVGLLPNLGASGVANLETAATYLTPPSMGMLPSIQSMIQSSVTLMPTILGKGAKQWRSGDWMCNGCNNHNFASRETCNRCGAQKEATVQPLPVS